MTKPLLRIQNLTMQFGGVYAAQGVEFDVFPGEILALIGPNGAGKTTTLNMLSGLLTPTSGEILFEDRSLLKVNAADRARLGIARTFQVVKPFEDMNVAENIATGAMFGPRQLSTGKAMAIAVDMMDRVGLRSKAHYSPGELTISDRKRLELARALAMEPKLLLLDEVMAGLNLGEVQKIMDLVVDINQQGVTVILIEHVMKVVMGISHRVVVLHYGKMLANGTPQKIARDPKVVEAYLGHRYAETAGGEA